MKLIVLAQTPPPVHGQSLMVQTLAEGLPAHGIEVHHVNLPLSRDAADIGRFRWGKLFTLLGACFRVYRIRRKFEGPITLYYVPAPAKRGALLRDWLAMLLCRPIRGRLVLHWHAVGLGHWLETHAGFLTRSLSRFFLGRADLALVLDDALATDAAFFDARQTLIVPNGIVDPGAPPARPPRNPAEPCKLLYLAACSEEKGLFELVEAVALAHARQPGSFRLTVAGAFASREDEQRFRLVAAQLGSSIFYHGFAGEQAKHALMREADIFCFPTHYPHEGQPLVLMEALAHDLPIVTTRWRAIPTMLPAAHTWIVQPGRPSLLADALFDARSSPRPGGASRRFYLENFTAGRHLATLSAALRSLDNGAEAPAEASEVGV
jgi:glycosyltransferase involved in cell wall biosynthesis